MSNSRPTGTCKLCLYEKELCDSHYLPKGMYRFARAPQLKNPNPIMNINGKLTQISDQFRGYVLCTDCERLLNFNGEKWVQANIPATYGSEFPLQNAIKKLQPIWSEQGLDIYNVSGEVAFDVQKLVYFGLSVFWRGAAHQWASSTGQLAPEVPLGTAQEPLRKFLMGAGPIPAEMVLLLYMWPFEDSKTIPGLWAPRSVDNPAIQEYWFCVPGLIYRLFIGKNFPDPIPVLNASDGIVSVDRQIGLEVLDYTKNGLISLERDPRIEGMLENIAKLRSSRG
jgi:hypothetical protein